MAFSNLLPLASAAGTASFDQTWRLWDIETGDCLLEQEGHSRSVYAVAFQVGVGGACVHCTAAVCAGRNCRRWSWLLLLLLQQGCMPTSVSLHPLPLAVQNDGALAASGGMDAIGRVWDCRTGRNIFTCEGHVKAVLSLDFSPNGYQLATGSEDNTARVWDLRKRGVLAILPGEGGGGGGCRLGEGRVAACLPASSVS